MSLPTQLGPNPVEDVVPAGQGSWFPVQNTTKSRMYFLS